MTHAVLGIIGGSGIYDLPGLENVRDESDRKPLGRALGAGPPRRYRGLPIVFLPRHDKGHGCRHPTSTTAPISTC